MKKFRKIITSFPDDWVIYEKYHDRRGTTMCYGIDEYGRKHIRVDFRKRVSTRLDISRFNSFYEPKLGYNRFEPVLVEGFYAIIDFLKYNKIARRWFKKIAFTFMFGNKSLGEWINKRTLELPWKELKVEEEKLYNHHFALHKVSKPNT